MNKLEDIVNLEYGWRIAVVNETLRGKSVRVLTASGWTSDKFTNSVRSEGAVCIVPIDPGEGFEIVAENEPCFDKELSFFRDGAWCPYCEPKGRSPATMIRDPKAYPDTLAFRRRKPEPVKECVMAQEEKREFYWACGPLELMTEQEARKKCVEVSPGFQRCLARIISTFEKVTTAVSEVKETRL